MVLTFRYVVAPLDEVKQVLVDLDKFRGGQLLISSTLQVCLVDLSLEKARIPRIDDLGQGSGSARLISRKI